MAKQSAAEHLHQYGYSITDNDGGMVRMKGRRVNDKFVPVTKGDTFTVRENGRDVEKVVAGDGFHYYRLEPDGDGGMVWNRILHHIGDDGEPDYLWPEDFIAHVYGTANRERAARAAEAG